MKRRTLIFAVCLIVISLIIAVNITSFRVAYIKLFKKTGNLYKTHNNRIDGEALEFVNGKNVMKWHYKNGIKQGPAIQYYENGKVEDSAYYQNNKVEGKEYKYYQDGKLNYTRSWYNGKLYGDVYRYDENGKLVEYGTCNIAGEKFFLYKYDGVNKIIGVDGFLVSNSMYSVDTKTNSLVIFKEDHLAHYQNVKALFITVASPPNATLKVDVTINGNHFLNVPIKDNTISIPNAFVSNGVNEIFIESHLYDKSNTVINGINIKTAIIKD